MNQNTDKRLKNASPYSAVITREQFLFYETRITAKLLEEGLSKEEVIGRIVADNLFQYPKGMFISPVFKEELKIDMPQFLLAKHGVA